MLRLIGLCYLMAFLTLAFQGPALLGPHGLLPVNGYLDAVATSLGSRGAGFRALPSVFWLGGGDGALRAAGWAGAALSTVVLLGQPGQSALSASTASVLVPGIAGAIGVATGDFHACAVLSGGRSNAGGDNTLASLGNGTTADSPTPVPVSEISGAVAIAAGGYQTCALLGDGTVRCWGTHSSQLTPLAVPGLTGAISISVGPKSACARVAGGEIECWRDNSTGQLGTGEIPDGRTTPKRVTTPQRVIAGD